MASRLGSISRSHKGEDWSASISDWPVSAIQALKIVDRDHDNFIAAMHRHMLRSVTFNPSHQLAEIRLGILQIPAVRRIAKRSWLRTRSLHLKSLLILVDPL